MKKSMAMIMLGLLVISMVPGVFAQDMERDRVRSDVRAVAISHERVMDIREKARDRADEARDVYRERAEQLRKLRDECKDNDSQECDNLRENAKTHTQEFLLSAADRMLGQLDKLLNRIENARLVDDEKADLIARVETKIAAVQEAKEMIEALTEESTREDFKAASQALRMAWSGASDDDGVKDILREGVSRVALHRFGNVLEGAEKLADRLDSIKERLGATDVDTSDFEEALREANSKLGALEAALDAHDLPEATKIMREAKASLADARRELANILSELRKSRGADNLIRSEAAEERENKRKELRDDSEDEVEVEGESETESENTERNETTDEVTA